MLHLTAYVIANVKFRYLNTKNVFSFNNKNFPKLFGDGNDAKNFSSVTSRVSSKSD